MHPSQNLAQADRNEVRQEVLRSRPCRKTMARQATFPEAPSGVFEIVDSRESIPGTPLPSNRVRKREREREREREGERGRHR